MLKTIHFVMTAKPMTQHVVMTARRITLCDAACIQTELAKRAAFEMPPLEVGERILV